MCTSNDLGDASGQDLTVGNTYEVIAFEQGMVRIVDDSGEDYLYPMSSFREVSRGASWTT